MNHNQPVSSFHQVAFDLFCVHSKSQQEPYATPYDQIKEVAVPEMTEGLPFEVNQKVSMPGFGIATFNGITKESYGGEPETLCKFTFANGSREFIPIRKLSEKNIRALSSEKIITDVISTLKSRRKSTKAGNTSGWIKLEIAFKTKLNSGDLQLVAEVVRDLHEDNPGDRSGFGRISLYAQGMKTLLEEITVIKGISREDALSFLQKESGKKLYDQKWNPSEALTMKARRAPTPPQDTSANEEAPEVAPTAAEKADSLDQQKPQKRKFQKGNPEKLRKVREARAKEEVVKAPPKQTEPENPSAELESLKKALDEAQSSLLEREQALAEASAATKAAEAKAQSLSEKLEQANSAIQSEQARSAELASKVKELEKDFVPSRMKLDKDGYLVFPEWDKRNKKTGS